MIQARVTALAESDDELDEAMNKKMLELISDSDENNSILTHNK